MNNLGLFFQFGVRMQGGPAFLKRQRSAVGQPQTRTRHGYTYTVSDRVWTEYSWLVCGSCTNYTQAVLDSQQLGGPRWPGSQCTGFGSSCSANIGYGGAVSCSTAQARGYKAMGVRCEPRTYTACAWHGYTGWSNVSSCTPASPGCSNGVLQRQCQTIYSWGARSNYEEVDVCIPTHPSLGPGAVEIECVPQ